MPLIRKLARFVALSPDEIKVLQDLQSQRRVVRRHREIITEGRNYDAIFVLLDGFAARCRILGNGGRQVLNIALPGDFLGFPGCFFEKALYSVIALSDAAISPIPHSRLIALFDTQPRLATKIFWSFACEAAMYAEHLIDVGRRSALERVAHFLLELHARLQLIGLADDASYHMPFTQELIGDALGLSVQHVNRTLRQLRDDGLLATENQRVIVKNIETLSALAGFEKTYCGPLRIPDLQIPSKGPSADEESRQIAEKPTAWLEPATGDAP